MVDIKGGVDNKFKIWGLALKGVETQPKNRDFLAYMLLHTNFDEYFECRFYRILKLEGLLLYLLCDQKPVEKVFFDDTKLRLTHRNNSKHII